MNKRAASACQRLPQRLQRQMMTQRPAQMPAAYRPRVDIIITPQLDKLTGKPDIGDVRYLHLIRTGDF
ncbi:MAG: hypothetical protein H7Y09_01385 [Chitinophagaceae bacterium]|nr:hypothetical protein [Anaerolineae bacterium]